MVHKYLQRCDKFYSRLFQLANCYAATVITSTCACLCVVTMLPVPIVYSFVQLFGGKNADADCSLRVTDRGWNKRVSKGGGRHL